MPPAPRCAVSHAHRWNETRRVGAPDSGVSDAVGIFSAAVDAETLLWPPSPRPKNVLS